MRSEDTSATVMELPACSDECTMPNPMAYFGNALAHHCMCRSQTQCIDMPLPPDAEHEGEPLTDCDRTIELLGEEVCSDNNALVYCAARCDRCTNDLNVCYLDEEAMSQDDDSDAHGSYDPSCEGETREGCALCGDEEEFVNCLM